jgi:hypothetical protein
MPIVVVSPGANASLAQRQAGLGAFEGRLKSRTQCGCSLCADQSRCTLDLLRPVSLTMLRTLQGPPCGARVRARLKARPTALAESRGLRPRRGASLSPSKPLEANRFLQRFHTELGETVLHQLPRILSYPSLGSLTKCSAAPPYCLRGRKD